MYKTGIIGATTRIAGELIRLLVNHPDVEIKDLYAQESVGTKISDIHHGLIGDIDLCITGRIDATGLDVIFICSDSPAIAHVIRNCPDTVIVDMRANSDLEGQEGFIYGLSEINRKPLVRGAKRAVTASPAAVAALVSLYPLAANLLLRDEISIHVMATDDVTSDTIMARAEKEIKQELTKVQQSFGNEVKITAEKATSSRGMTIQMTLPISLSLDEIDKLYEAIYDDHNFTFVIHTPISLEEVEGTNKCIISLTKPADDKIFIETIIDCRLRGCAGEAVHVMNLLLGLAERTGLMLKASTY